MSEVRPLRCRARPPARLSAQRLRHPGRGLSLQARQRVVAGASAECPGSGREHSPRWFGLHLDLLRCPAFQQGPPGQSCFVPGLALASVPMPGYWAPEPPGTLLEKADS